MTERMSNTGLYIAPSGTEMELFETADGEWTIRVWLPSRDVFVKDSYSSEAAARRSFAERIIDDLRPAVAS